MLCSFNFSFTCKAKGCEAQTPHMSWPRLKGVHLIFPHTVSLKEKKNVTHCGID